MVLWRYRRSSDRCLPRPDAPSQRFRSVASWAMAFYGARSTPPIFSSAVLQTEVVGSFFHSRLEPPSAVAGGAPCAPLDGGTLALLRSALGRFLGRWYFTYQRFSPGAVNRADDIPALFWQVILRFPPGAPPDPGKPPLAVALVALLSHSFGRCPLTHWRYP